MNFELSVNAAERYVEVIVRSDMTRSLATEVSQRAQQAMRQHKLAATLIDLRTSRNVEQAPQNYFFVHEDASMLELSQSDRIALLVAPEDHSHDFVEMVLRNAGFSVRLFRDEAAARAWIRENPESSATIDARDG
ncbi:MAG: STAS/SEC14 domain-containing protein [Pseudomonadota bacterium]|nr:hypothetical protein [Pseudomonadales bacterium]MDY6919605.1 STAS/SEC14 domain-containing protein [Pseudomonadota bacterium]